MSDGRQSGPAEEVNNGHAHNTGATFQVKLEKTSHSMGKDFWLAEGIRYWRGNDEINNLAKLFNRCDTHCNS